MIGSGYLTHTRIMNEINRGEVAANLNVFFFRLHPTKPLSKNVALNGMRLSSENWTGLQVAHA